jgi:hypothetical protein
LPEKVTTNFNPNPSTFLNVPSLHVVQTPQQPHKNHAHHSKSPFAPNDPRQKFRVRHPSPWIHFGLVDATKYGPRFVVYADPQTVEKELMDETKQYLCEFVTVEKSVSPGGIDGTLLGSMMGSTNKRKYLSVPQFLVSYV